MGDLIKDNPFTASVLLSLTLLVLVLMFVAKPYIDSKDKAILELIEQRDKIYMGNQQVIIDNLIEINKKIKEDGQ